MSNFARNFNFTNNTLITTQILPENLSQNIAPYKFTEESFTSCTITPKLQKNRLNFYSSLVQHIKKDFPLSNLHRVIYENINKTNTTNLHELILDNLNKECEEEGYEVFDEIARTNAKKVLNFLCEKLPEYDYDIYPTDEREINIEFYSFKGRILILCDSEGSVAYFKHLNGKISRHRCQDIIDFPFDQLYKEFESFRDPTEKNVLYNNNSSNIESFEMLNNEYRCA